MNGRDGEVPAWIPLLFRFAAAQNWMVSVPPMVAPRRMARLLGDDEPQPAFPTQAWAGMAVMFGFMFREIASDPVGRRALVRYAWVEKLVSATAMTVGYRAGDASRSAMAMITFADWAMIPPFIYAKRRLDRIADRRPSAAPAEPGPGRGG